LACPLFVFLQIDLSCFFTANPFSASSYTDERHVVLIGLFKEVELKGPGHLWQHREVGNEWIDRYGATSSLPKRQ